MRAVLFVKNQNWLRPLAVFILCLCLTLLPSSRGTKTPSANIARTPAATGSGPAAGEPSTTAAPDTGSSQPAVTTAATSGSGEPSTSDTSGQSMAAGRGLKVRVLQATLYTAPQPQAPVSGSLSWLTPVQATGPAVEPGFVPVAAADGRQGWCLESDLADREASLYAQVPELQALSAVPNRKDPPRFSQLVDVRQAAPDICIDLVFAGTRNFTGVQFYERDICLLQKNTLDKLRRAQAHFRADGFSIKIYDAYRPYSVTVRLAAINSNSVYLADPRTGSAHNRGAAVDMTLVDANGVEVEMPSLMHTMDRRASRKNPDMTPAARQNLAYVQQIMVQNGFISYDAEWWHYSDSDSGRYPHLDLSLAEIDMVPGVAVSAEKPPPVRDPLTTGFVQIPAHLVPKPTPAPAARSTAPRTSGTR